MCVCVCDLVSFEKKSIVNIMNCGFAIYELNYYQISFKKHQSNYLVHKINHSSVLKFNDCNFTIC